MFAKAVPFARSWFDAMLDRPLSLREALAVGAVLLTAGTVYCQIYCLLAIQQMHGASMPLLASIHRASVDIVPAFVVFELGKRLQLRGRPSQWLAIAALFAIAIALAAAWRMQLHIMSGGLTPRRMMVDRIPFMALAAAGIAYHHRRARLRFGQAHRADALETMPPAKAIDWVKAAGNYVEIKAGSRTRLLRMTLRQTSIMLPEDQFVQIHRSVIVNRDRVQGTDRRRVVMADGTEFSVGDAYRSNLAR